MRTRQLVWVLIGLVWFLSARGRAEEALVSGLDEVAEKARAAFQIPGLAVGVVRGDEAIYAKGFGVCKLGENAPVTADTVFPIASTSKAFTSAALGILVSEGKIGWDDPVCKHLTGFQLYDSYVTQNTTIRDLLCHRSGLSGDGTVTVQWNYSRTELLNRLSFVAPEGGFRTQWNYSNLGILVAGQVIPAVTGQSWDEFVAQRIFKPLGMNSSSTSLDGLAKLPSVASPHGLWNGGVVPIPYLNLASQGPAGSVNSTVRDMTQWLRLQLNAGQYAGRQIIGAEAVAEMHRPQVICPPKAKNHPFAESNTFTNYGLCWGVEDYYGTLVVMHTGESDGVSSIVMLLPQYKVGVVVLTNLFGKNYATNAIAYSLLDRLVNRKTDWVGVLADIRQKAIAKTAAQIEALRQTRVPDTKPTFDLAKYAGTYNNPLYGDVVVALVDGKLTFTAGALQAPLEPWNYDTFEMKWSRPNQVNEMPNCANFAIDMSGNPSTLHWLIGGGEFAVFHAVRQ